MILFSCAHAVDFNCETSQFKILKCQVCQNEAKGHDFHLIQQIALNC